MVIAYNFHYESGFECFSELILGLANYQFPFCACPWKTGSIKGWMVFHLKTTVSGKRSIQKITQKIRTEQR